MGEISLEMLKEFGDGLATISRRHLIEDGNIGPVLFPLRDASNSVAIPLDASDEGISQWDSLMDDEVQRGASAIVLRYEGVSASDMISYGEDVDDSKKFDAIIIMIYTKDTTLLRRVAFSKVDGQFGFIDMGWTERGLTDKPFPNPYKKS